MLMTPPSPASQKIVSVQRTRPARIASRREDHARAAQLYRQLLVQLPGNLQTRVSRLLQRLAADAEDRLPDLLRVVFNPAILRVDLSEFLLILSNAVAVGIENHSA